VVGVGLGREMEGRFNLLGAWLDSSLQVAYVIGRYDESGKIYHIFANNRTKRNRTVACLLWCCRGVLFLCPLFLCLSAP